MRHVSATTGQEYTIVLAKRRSKTALKVLEAPHSSLIVPGLDEDTCSLIISGVGLCSQAVAR